MPTRYARRAITNSTRGYVCLACRLEYVASSNGRNLRYQHTNGPAEDKHSDKYSQPPTTSTRIRGIYSTPQEKVETANLDRAELKVCFRPQVSLYERPRDIIADTTKPLGKDTDAKPAVKDPTLRVIQKENIAQRRRRKELVAVQRGNLSTENAAGIGKSETGSEKLAVGRHVGQFGTRRVRSRLIRKFIREEKRKQAADTSEHAQIKGNGAKKDETLDSVVRRTFKPTDRLPNSKSPTEVLEGNKANGKKNDVETEAGFEATDSSKTKVKKAKRKSRPGEKEPATSQPDLLERFSESLRAKQASKSESAKQVIEKKKGAVEPEVSKKKKGAIQTEVSKKKKGATETDVSKKKKEVVIAVGSKKKLGAKEASGSIKKLRAKEAAAGKKKDPTKAELEREKKLAADLESKVRKLKERLDTTVAREIRQSNSKNRHSLPRQLKFSGASSSEGGEQSKSSVEHADASQLKIEPVHVAQPPVPKLAYGLERVLFNPGVYQLQDPRSRVYNFDPYLQKIMPVGEFDFKALKEYITSSQDTALKTIAKAHGKRYIGSTSSMTSVLAHFHFLLSQWRTVNVKMLSRGINTEKNKNSFTEIQRTPSAIFLRWQNGSYAIDADKQFASANILSMLGKSMEKLLTLDTKDFERYRKSSLDHVTEEEQFAPETYHYSTLGDFLMRSQLDAYDPRLPGTGMFDLKTRAVISIRMDVTKYEHGIGYEIKNRHGEWESYEREYYDMIRAAFLKYSMQVRMGRMDGIFVAFHNIERIFGFQYISLPEMDAAIHGQSDTAAGDQEFGLSLGLLNKILDKATQRYPETSLRIHFETRDAATPFMYIFAEPMTEEQVAEIQSRNDAKIREFEESLFSQGNGEFDQAKGLEDEDSRWADIQANVEEAMNKDEFGLEDLPEEEAGHLQDGRGTGKDIDGLEIVEQGPLSSKRKEPEAEDGAKAGVAGDDEDEDEEDGEEQGDDDEEEEEEGDANEEENGEEDDEPEEEKGDMDADAGNEEAEVEGVEDNVSTDPDIEGIEEPAEGAVETASDLEQDHSEREGVMTPSGGTNEPEDTTSGETDDDATPALIEDIAAESETHESLVEDTAPSSDLGSATKELLLEVPNADKGPEAEAEADLPKRELQATDLASEQDSSHALQPDEYFPETPPTSEDDPLSPPEADGTFLDFIAGDDPTSEDTDASKASILAMTLTLRNKVNDAFVLRPENITADDNWSVEYSLVEIQEERRAKALYEACQKRRMKKLGSYEEDAEEDDDPGWVNGYVRNLRDMAKKGKVWRKEMDRRDRGREVRVLGREGGGDGDGGGGGKDDRGEEESGEGRS